MFNEHTLSHQRNDRLSLLHTEGGHNNRRFHWLIPTAFVFVFVIKKLAPQRLPNQISKRATITDAVITHMSRGCVVMWQFSTELTIDSAKNVK